jgi:hypothetical protein
MGIPERAEHGTVRRWFSFTGDDLHLDPAPPAGEGRGDVEKIRI